ncbi:hypothetical protein Nepgr_025988 [Nepenthes gracilis]|uniref:Uncharacterized protein n=1 Tax=Nepenthes gracilis TaxID=150966 RepID=A0AAD3T733_NEPGR|nr:hypothetical protein Nepgr_025988 [Nepenthes gracilis]
MLIFPCHAYCLMRLTILMMQSGTTASLIAVCRIGLDKFNWSNRPSMYLGFAVVVMIDAVYFGMMADVSDVDAGVSSVLFFFLLGVGALLQLPRAYVGWLAALLLLGILLNWRVVAMLYTSTVSSDLARLLKWMGVNSMRLHGRSCWSCCWSCCGATDMLMILRLVAMLIVLQVVLAFATPEVRVRLGSGSFIVFA